MFEKFALFIVLLIMALSTIEFVRCQDNLELQRIEKRSRPQNGNNNDDFEKFFLKASKSVPRIGRRRITEPPSDTKRKFIKIR